MVVLKLMERALRCRLGSRVYRDQLLLEPSVAVGPIIRIHYYVVGGSSCGDTGVTRFGGRWQRLIAQDGKVKSLMEDGECISRYPVARGENRRVS